MSLIIYDATNGVFLSSVLQLTFYYKTKTGFTPLVQEISS